MARAKGKKRATFINFFKKKWKELTGSGAAIILFSFLTAIGSDAGHLFFNTISAPGSKTRGDHQIEDTGDQAEKLDGVYRNPYIKKTDITPEMNTETSSSLRDTDYCRQ